MKWIKRLLIVVVVLLVLAVCAGLVVRRLSHSRPDWYPAAAWDKASMAAAARSVENKLTGVQNWAADSNANERNRQNGIKPGSPGYTAAPEPVKQLSFTEAELNAFFLKWDTDQGWKNHYSNYVEEPVLVLQDNRLILAGTVKEMDTLVSVHFEPSIDDDGKLRLRLVKVMGGKLPLPHAFWDSYRQKMCDAMARKVEQAQAGARIADDGSVNGDTVVAAMNELLLNSLNDRPAEPYLFLKHDPSHPNNAFPVRLTGIKIADKTIDLTVVPLTPDQRKQLLEKIKQPLQTAGGGAEGSAG